MAQKNVSANFKGRNVAAALAHTYSFNIYVVVRKKKQVQKTRSGSEEMARTVILFHDRRKWRRECRGDYLPPIALEICKYVR